MDPSSKMPSFPVSLHQADCEFILLGHHLRRPKNGICHKCQSSILDTFYVLSAENNTGLQLFPTQLSGKRYSPEIRQRLDHARINILSWQVKNRAAFDDLLHNNWLAMFESAKARIDNTTQQQQRPANPKFPTPINAAAAATEEWLTKLWHACAGRYSAADLARGRPYTGWRGFEGMHLRRLVAGQRPYHGVKCECSADGGAWNRLPGSDADRTGLPALGWLPASADCLGGLPSQSWLTGPAPHAGVLMRYTDRAICDAYARLCGELAARGDGAKVMALARMWDQPGFRERLVLMVQRAERRVREDAECIEAAKTLMLMRHGRNGQASWGLWPMGEISE
ncbi:hypothetical protein B0I37DRAFT_195061 [Chaetomium sp. MPI-CAGE-AT-0009]|nr:hypothetical protein B0I37DRAFT_195061 [Chaetomium sp. MPI-CAGE-AT-0009]